MPRNKVPLLYTYFASYYAAQGLMQAFSGFEQPYLQSYGISLEDVGFAQGLAQLPWVVKIIFCIPSDMWNCGGLGFRRPYAVAGLAIGALFLFVLGSFSPGGSNFPLYIFVAILRNTGTCLSDVATDGFAVDCNMEEQSGMINSVMTVGRMIGLAIGSQVAGAVAERYGFNAMITVLSIMIGCLVWIPLLLKEERVVGTHSFEWSAFKHFGRREVLLFLAAACASNGGLAVANFPLAKWQRERFGFGLEEVGTAALVSSVGMLIGSLGNGPLFDRVNKRAAMLLAGALSSATLLSYLLAFNAGSVMACRFFAGASEGALWIVQAGLTMRLAPKSAGASFFGLAIMAMNLSIMLGTTVAGWLAENYGLEACFLVGGIVSFTQLLPLPWLGSIDKKKPAQSAGEGEGEAAGTTDAVVVAAGDASPGSSGGAGADGGDKPEFSSQSATAAAFASGAAESRSFADAEAGRGLAAAAHTFADEDEDAWSALAPDLAPALAPAAIGSAGLHIGASKGSASVTIGADAAAGSGEDVVSSPSANPLAGDASPAPTFHPSVRVAAGAETS